MPTNAAANWLLFFFDLSYERKARTMLSGSWRSGNEKYFCLLFVASRTLLQRHVESNKLL